MHFIFSSGFSFYPQRVQTLPNKSNQCVSKALWLVLFVKIQDTLSPALLVPAWTPAISSSAALPSQLYFRISLSLSWFCFTFETSEALLSLWSGMAVFFESSSVRKSLCWSAVLPLCAATLLLWLRFRKNLSELESLADKLLQYFSCLTYSPFLLFVGP